MGLIVAAGLRPRSRVPQKSSNRVCTACLSRVRSINKARAWLEEVADKAGVSKDQLRLDLAGGCCISYIGSPEDRMKVNAALASDEMQNKLEEGVEVTINEFSH